MPLQKPSPHRFIAPTAASSTPKSKPKSNLRHAIAAHTPKQMSELQFKKITPAKRFVVAPPQKANTEDVTPRAAVPDRVEEPDSSASIDNTPRPRQQRKLGRVESIEEASQSSPSRPPDEDVFDIVQTIEHEPMLDRDEGDERGEVQEEDDGDELLFETSRPKRRRTSPPSPTLHPRPPPETPAGAASHRFRFAHAPQTPVPLTNLSALASTSQTPKTTTPPAPLSARPHFILPAPPSPSKPSKPLPEIFSPSRKNQKYISSGLASTVQGWIIEATQTGFAGGVVYGREREDGFKVRVRVSGLGSEGSTGGGGEDGKEEVECGPGGVVFVRGDMEPGICDSSSASSTAGEDEGLRVLLAGQGGARGSGGVKVKVGDVVGIRAPTWDIEVGGEKWVVGVDWAVL